MEVTVRYLNPLREVTKISEEKVEVKEGDSVEDLVHMLSKKYGSGFDRYAYSGVKQEGIPILILVDGQNVQSLEGAKTKLRQGNVITIIPPIAGG